jgi:hypothetical protein
MDLTVLGLPLETDSDFDLEQPLEAVVVVKGIDKSGGISHWAARTPGLSNIEITGMAMWALDVARGK